MRLILLILLTLVAFASNSVLNRMALAGGDTGPAAFAALRTISGAIFLAALVAMRSGLPKVASPRRWIGTGALTVYMLGFSYAYIALDAGVGALILFGGVQITMFAGALLGGERPAPARWIGSFVAFGGLAWLLSPTTDAGPDLTGALLMTLAALGWGIYSLEGRRVSDPLGETAANFICSTPFVLAAWVALPDDMSARGVMLAVLAGAITSGMGYAMWYTVLPRLASSMAALLQLTVPVIALGGGLLFLAEVPSLRFLVAGAVVLGGVAFGIIAGRQRTRGSSGS